MSEIRQKVQADNVKAFVSQMTPEERASLVYLRDELRRDMDDAARYRKLRKLTPREFGDLWKRGMGGNKPFDELVDELP